MEVWRATISKIFSATRAFLIVSFITTRALTDLILWPVVHFSMLFIPSLLQYKGKHVQKSGLSVSKNPTWAPKVAQFKINWVFGHQKL